MANALISVLGKACVQSFERWRSVRGGEGIISLSVKDALLARCIGGAREELDINVLRLPTISNALACQYLQAGWLG